MRITEIDGIALRLPVVDTTRNDPTQEVVIVRVITDTGLVGLAECNHSIDGVLAVLGAKGAASIGVGLTAPFLGGDPADRAQLIREAYEQNIFSFRRGLGLAVLHAIDVCLWDLVAQSRGEPLWQTLWGDRAVEPRPYLTLYTGPGTISESMRTLARLIEDGMHLGYHAAKLEPLVDCVPEESIVAFVAEGRRLLGDDVELFVDFGHRFRDAETAAQQIASIAEYRPAMIETPMLTDDVWEYARLAELTEVPLAASELYESGWEFRALIDVGRIAIAQPWPTRVGITETLAVAERVSAAGGRCILAGWNTTSLGVAAGVHVAAGLGSGITFEHAPTESYGFALRGVAAPEPLLRDGSMELSASPGLGVSLDPEAVARYRVRPPSTR